MMPSTPRAVRTEPIHLRAPIDLLRELDREAVRRRQTRTRVIWDAVRRELDVSRAVSG